MKEEKVLEYAKDPNQWRYLSEFIKWERAVGGPDPHMALTGYMCQGMSWEERAWRGGCYLGVYNVPSGEALWRHVSYGKALEEPEGIEPWIAANWAGFAFRRERRAARSAKKLATYLTSYARWISTAREQPWWDTAYDPAWKAVDEVYSAGRYIKLKILEYLWRYCEAPFRLKDMRGKGGWSPRTALCLFYPQHANALLGADTPENVAKSEHLALTAKGHLADEFGIDLDFYNLQVLLCDYKQSYAGRRQFPGRSQDSEMMYANKIWPHWGYESGIWQARRDSVPNEALGELHGWGGVREELADVLRDRGYTWSDIRFDYLATNGDYYNPVERAGWQERARELGVVGV